MLVAIVSIRWQPGSGCTSKDTTIASQWEFAVRYLAGSVLVDLAHRRCL